MPTLYDELVENGIEIRSHESDLYFPMTLESMNILAKYPTHKANARIFKNGMTGEAWHDVPFAYLPWWESRYKTMEDIDKEYSYKRTKTGAFDIPVADKPVVEPSNPEFRRDFIKKD